jgi:hypothetical protein
MFLPNEEHFCHQIPVLYLDLAKEIYRVTFFFHGHTINKPSIKGHGVCY